jgi:hypothetical protein
MSNYNINLLVQQYFEQVTLKNIPEKDVKDIKRSENKLVIITDYQIYDIWTR